MAITTVDFDFIRALVRKRSAITLEPGKEYLAETRLQRLADTEGLGSVEQLVARLRTDNGRALTEKVVEAMTTNETSFFRDLHPFLALEKTILPELIRKRSAERKLEIWCAAASTGQEPFTVAMILVDRFRELAGWDVRFTATDINGEVLRKASAGRFSQIEVNRGLPAPMLVKYFTKQGGDWVLKDDVRRLVKFQQMNLIEPWPDLGRPDIVFLRNVLIYFDVETKKRLLGKVRQILRPDGCLFLGGSETTYQLDDHFERLPIERASCYRLTHTG